jgi:hypothetical protein
MPHLDALTRLFVTPFQAKPAAPRISQDLEVRAMEERFGRAADIAEFTRLERDFEARDAGGWNWR